VTDYELFSCYWSQLTTVQFAAAAGRVVVSCLWPTWV